MDASLLTCMYSWYLTEQSSLNATVVVTDTTLLDSPFEAVHVMGKDNFSVSHLHFSNVTSNRTGTFFLQVQCPLQAMFSTTAANQDGVSGMYLCPGTATNITLLGGNRGDWWNTTTCSMPPTPPSPPV